MYSTISLATLAALAAVVAATPDARNLDRFRNHVARQTQSQGGDANAVECTAGLLGLAADMPTPTGDLMTWLAAQATQASTISDLCQDAPPVPTSLISQYSSYETALVGWYSSESESIQSLVSSCSGQENFSQVESLLTLVDQATSSCLATTSSGSMTGSQTGSSASQTESVTSTITTSSVVVTESNGSSFSITVPVTTTTTGVPTDQPAAAPRATAGAVLAAAGAIGAAILM